TIRQEGARIYFFSWDNPPKCCLYRLKTTKKPKKGLAKQHIWEDLKMSAVNFATMENFPLYVLNSTTCPVCPSCGTPWDNDNGDTCLECGYQGEPEEAYDSFEDAYNSRAL